MRLRALVGGGLVILLQVGCRPSEQPKPAGSDLPVTSGRSVALPGATDAADAPHAPQVVESQRADQTTYRDPATGVSFSYPAAWRPAIAGQSPIAPDFEAGAGKARITQQFLPEGTPYAQTVLRALMFSYTVQGASNASACADLAKRVPAASTPVQVRYGNALYTEAVGGDGAACTEVRTQLDTTLQAKQCFVFERDFVTGCPNIKNSNTPRPLTGKETAALQQHLDAIMESVQLTSKATDGGR